MTKIFFEKHAQVSRILNLAEMGQFDGAHHKTWVIDQIVREVLGDSYDKFIKDYEEDGEYEWDTGVAP